MRAFGYIGIPHAKVVLRVLVFVMGEPSGASDSLVSLHIHYFGQPQYWRSITPGLLPQDAVPIERGDSARDSPQPGCGHLRVFFISCGGDSKDWVHMIDDDLYDGKRHL